MFLLCVKHHGKHGPEIVLSDSIIYYENNTNKIDFHILFLN